MIKLSNIAAAWAALRGTTDSLQEDTQRRIHDFMGYLPPEHKTPRRILQHLNNTIACDDLGGTAFCLWALYEGLANMADPIVHRRILVQESWPNNTSAQDSANNEANQQTRRWLNSVASNPSIYLGEGFDSKFKRQFLVVGIQTNSLEIINTNDQTWLKIPDYNILIEPYVKGEFNLKRLAKDDDNQKIDPKKLQKDEGILTVKTLKGHSKKINNVTYAKCWVYQTQNGENNYGRIPSQKSIRINDLELTDYIRDRGQAILEKIKAARHAYAHDFKKLAADQGWSSTLMAYEFFDVFEPIFQELARMSYSEDKNDT